MNPLNGLYIVTAFNLLMAFICLRYAIKTGLLTDYFWITYWLGAFIINMSAMAIRHAKELAQIWEKL